MPFLRTRRNTLSMIVADLYPSRSFLRLPGALELCDRFEAFYGCAFLHKLVVAASAAATKCDRQRGASTIRRIIGHCRRRRVAAFVFPGLQSLLVLLRFEPPGAIPGRPDGGRDHAERESQYDSAGDHAEREPNTMGFATEIICASLCNVGTLSEPLVAICSCRRPDFDAHRYSDVRQSGPRRPETDQPQTVASELAAISCAAPRWKMFFARSISRLSYGMYRNQNIPGPDFSLIALCLVFRDADSHQGTDNSTRSSHRWRRR